MISTAFSVEESWCMAKALTPFKTEEIIIVYIQLKSAKQILYNKYPLISSNNVDLSSID